MFNQMLETIQPLALDDVDAALEQFRDANGRSLGTCGHGINRHGLFDYPGNPLTRNIDYAAQKTAEQGDHSIVYEPVEYTTVVFFQDMLYVIFLKGAFVDYVI